MKFVLVLLCFTGCATTQNINDAFSDPERRTHTLARISESVVGVAAGVGAYYGCKKLTDSEIIAWCCALVAGPLTEFLFFEFVLEPAGVTGHYWERGSRKSGGYKKP